MRGFTGLDWIISLVIVVFAIRGFLRGTIRQVFGLLGLLTALWAAAWVSQWVGAHWRDARPAVVFWILTWLVAGLAGLAAASLLGWAGERLAAAVHSTPVGWLDPVGGFALGGSIALVVVTLLLLVFTSVTWPTPARRWTTASRITPALFEAGATASRWTAPLLPRGLWLRDRFLEAHRRLTRPARAS